MRLGGICHYPNLYRMTMRTKENRLLQKHVMDHWWWSTTTARKFSNNIWPWELDARPLSDSVPSPWGWKCSKSNSNLSLSVPGRGLGDQTNTDAWASLGIAHCPRRPSLPRPRGFAQRHCQFFDWTISMQATQFLLTMSSVDHWIYSCTIIASHLRCIVVCKHPLV